MGKVKSNTCATLRDYENEQGALRQDIASRESTRKRRLYGFDRNGLGNLTFAANMAKNIKGAVIIDHKSIQLSPSIKGGKAMESCRDC
jgi:hypothetical protein